MDHAELRQRFAALTTAHVADACIRAQVAVRCAPSALQAAVPGSHIAGRVCPARHAGSVDIFLEAFESATAGGVLVVDNGGRLDEACVGDLVALEAQTAGLEAMVIWGLHRDTADIHAIALPLFSLGSLPTGPQRLDARHPEALRSATVGEWTVSCEDIVFGDAGWSALCSGRSRRRDPHARGNDPRHRATPGGSHSQRRLAAGAGALRRLSCGPQ